VTHVAAKAINPTYFNLPSSSEAPAFVLTTDNSTAPFNSIQTEALVRTPLIPAWRLLGLTVRDVMID
jgi:hypothetical protein